MSLPTQKHSNVSRGVLIERAHYYTILIDGVRTIREGVLIKEGALNEVGRYMCFIFHLRKLFCTSFVLSFLSKLTNFIVFTSDDHHKQQGLFILC